MLVTLTIIRYKKRHIPFALLAMLLFHLPLRQRPTISFYKLLGCGKNGSFDIHPEWQQWGILAVHTLPLDACNFTLPQLYGKFVFRWLQFFKCSPYSIYLEPLEGNGHWDGKACFGKLATHSTYDGPVAVLTRASIRLSKLFSFWKNVSHVARQSAIANGLLFSTGIGELPLIKQATFSVWKDKKSMKAFAYENKSHTAVIEKTKQQRWYSEEMFVRFRLIKTSGTLAGNNPLKGIC